MADRVGKSRLTMPSTSTLPTAMPAPANTDEANSSGRLGQARSAVPRQISKSAPSRVRSTPKRRAKAGAGAANRPRQTMGRVVSRLAPVAPRPVSRMMSGSTTDRLPNTGRRLKAISSRHRPSSQGCAGRAGAPGLMAKRVDAPPACCVAGFTPGAAAAPRALEAPLAKEEGAGARGVGWVSGMKLCTVGTFAALRTPGKTVKGQNGGQTKKRSCCKNAGFQCVHKPAAGRQSGFRRIGGLDALCAIFPWQICSFWQKVPLAQAQTAPEALVLIAK